jgi:hypothetical protein
MFSDLSQKQLGNHPRSLKKRTSPARSPKLLGGYASKWYCYMTRLGRALEFLHPSGYGIERCQLGPKSYRSDSQVPKYSREDSGRQIYEYTERL